MYELLRDAFVIGQEFGLRTYLSTRILHGSLEGELRASMAKRGLLLSGNPTEAKASARKYWSDKISSSYDEEAREKTFGALVKFSTRVTQLINTLKDHKIRIKMTGSPDGLFDFTETDDEIHLLMEQIVADTPFDRFVEILFSDYWTRVDRSLVVIEREISQTFKNLMELEFLALTKTIEECKISRLDRYFSWILSTE